MTALPAGVLTPAPVGIDPAAAVDSGAEDLLNTVKDTQQPGATGVPDFSNMDLGSPINTLPFLTQDEFLDQFGDSSTPGTNRFTHTTNMSPGANQRSEKLSGRMPGGVAGSLVKQAIKFVGTPYVWGGTSPSGFDCSGFVQYVFKQIGVNLPRVSFQQARAGQRVELGKLQTGDLVAWDNSSRNPGADHIAIYIGNNQIIEAPRPGVAVRIRSLGKGEKAWGVRLLNIPTTVGPSMHFPGA